MSIDDLVIPQDPLSGIYRGYGMVFMLAAALGITSGLRHVQKVGLQLDPDERTVMHRRTVPPKPIPDIKPEPKPPADIPAQPKPIPITKPRPAPVYKPVQAAHFSDPKGSLLHFFKSLEETKTGKARRPTRLLYLSNSEIGFDRVTSQMRRVLQERFGDGGKGFMVIAPGWRYQRHRDIVWKRNANWKLDTVLDTPRPDGRFGLGGVLAMNRGKAWAEFSTVSKEYALDYGYHEFATGLSFSRFQLFYQVYPGGGPVRIEVDGGQFEDTILTNSFEVRDKVFTAELEDSSHTVRVSANGFPARLYGVVMERDHGLVLDAVMVVGAYADTQLNQNPAHLKRQLSLRKPDLVIFQWGAKELMENEDFTARQTWSFRRAYVKAVNKTMAGAPAASCLIISPKDIGMRRRNFIVTKPAVPKAVRAAEEAAEQTGCAFINLFQALGGPGTMGRWYHSKPKKVSPDLGHIMRPGAWQVGNVLSNMLLNGYKQYMAQDLEGPAPIEVRAPKPKSPSL